MAELLGWWTCCCRFHFFSGFSVVFESAGCSGLAGGCTPFVLLAWTFSAEGTNSWGSKGMPPWEICKIGLSKLQFPVLPEMMYKWNVRKTDLDRCSLIKGQGQLSVNLSGQLSKVRVSCWWTCLVSYSWQGGGKGWGMMNNHFIIHVYDKNYLFFSNVCIT